MPTKIPPVTSTLLFLLLTTSTVLQTTADEYNAPNLPAHHLPFYYAKPTTTLISQGEPPGVEPNGGPEKDGEIKSTVVNQNFCWGYEETCDFTKPFSFSYPLPIPLKEGVNPDRRLPYSGDPPPSVDEGRALFYNQADFGYIKDFRNSLQNVCIPKPQSGDSKTQNRASVTSSSLECTELLGFCRGRNIVIDFRHLVNRSTPIVYDMNVLRDGDIGGNCELDNNFLIGKSRYEAALTTWGPEIKHFKQMPANWAMDADHCDVILDRPTFIMKLDATSNMYHHFCDFFNFYATLFVNASGEPGHDMFATNVDILIWRSWYRSNFETAFDAFTENPLLNLANFFGQRVCFRDVVFSLLPRMVAGLYYSTPVVPGYRGSGLFRAFSDFMLHRLKIPLHQSEPNVRKLRVTFLSRRTTFRKILNEDELIREIEKNSPNLIVKKVEFTEKTDFFEQLAIIRNTDILIGIHGAGLTHLLFLPKWAVVFEIYDCEDPNCYSELARLAGVKYLTWEKMEKLEVKQVSANLDVPKHYQKHANYVFDPEETVRLVNKAKNLLLKKFEDSADKNRGHDEL